MPVVYTETVIHSAPESFAAEAPYQIAIIEFEDGRRVLVRIEGERVVIGDKVTPAEKNRFTKSPT